MSALLGLLLIAQLNSFEFTAIPGPQTAGDSFQITVIARDPSGGIHPYNGSALLSTSKDGLWSYVQPGVITFQNGVWQNDVIITLADTLYLRCVEPQNLITGQSNSFAVFSGPPDRLLLILPGEQYAPGSPDGKLPNPPRNQVAGTGFDIAAYLTDRWHNTIEARSDSVYFGATDRFADIPPGQLSDGSGSFPATLRAAGNQRLHGHPATGSPVTPDTSSSLAVNAGPYEQLLMLLPGETHLPGDTTTRPWAMPGKEGRPEEQFLGIPFPVEVQAADNCWNIVTAAAESVALSSFFPFNSVPEQAKLGETFQVEFLTAGPNQNLSARTLAGVSSYMSWVNIRPRTSLLEVEAPDTVRAGETTFVRVTMRDDNGLPVVAAPCRFSVIAGNGDMLDSALLSDTLGRVTARFLCSRARGDELNTIKVTADTVVTADIFVEMPDPSLLDGNIVVFPNPFGFNQDRAKITYYLRAAAPMTVTIYDTFGNEITNWKFGTGLEGARAGVNRIYWDGRNRSGRRVANGIYVVQVIGERHTGTTFNSSQRIGVIW